MPPQCGQRGGSVGSGAVSSSQSSPARLAALPAANVPDGAVQPHEPFGAGALVQAVDVLRDQREARPFARPSRENVVRRIRLRPSRSSAGASRTTPTRACGSFSNASGVASVSARTFFHRPSAPRNVGMPDAADTPAPVSAVMRRARPSASATRARSLGSIGQSRPAEFRDEGHIDWSRRGVSTL